MHIMYAENLHHSVAPSPSCILPSDTRANTRQSGRIHAALLPTSRKIASLPRQRAIRPSHAVPCHLALILAQKCDAAEATRYSPFSRSTLRSYSAGSERLCASMAESLSGAVDETGGCAARRDVAAFLFASLVRPPPLARLGASAGSARLCASMAEALSGAVDERGGCAAPRDVAAFLFASLACPPPLPRPEPRPIVRSSRFSKFRTLALQLLAGLAGWFSRHWATARPARLASRRLPAAVCIAAGPAPALPLQRAAKPFDANRPLLSWPSWSVFRKLFYEWEINSFPERRLSNNSLLAGRGRL